VRQQRRFRQFRAVKASRYGKPPLFDRQGSWERGLDDCPGCLEQRGGCVPTLSGRHGLMVF